jgi:1,4-alpha-glucan branching enzyme
LVDLHCEAFVSDNNNRYPPAAAMPAQHPAAPPEEDGARAADATHAYFFAEGTHEQLWHWLGAHASVDGTRFRVWAPNASRVAVVGDFNDWDSSRHALHSLGDSGVWELRVPEARIGHYYKFALNDRHGSPLPLKADPLALAMQRAPQDASIICDRKPFAWNDGDWMARRGDTLSRAAPVSIYEVHSASWRRRDDGSYLNFGELAEQLIPYVLELGFTHIQFMPMSEYPFDGSWGYQPIGLFAPTSRHGWPDDYRRFIDRCHQAGLGVIQDWVPAHFPTDTHGLARFDGTALYEHADPRKGFHQDWNTAIYNFGRNEVISFLLSNAQFWLDEYHIDGLRVDAVASMLYLDYSRADGEWLPNEHGGNENLEAIALLRRVNERVYARHPGIAMIAEESTAWPGVSRPTDSGGLGFGYKWNMGWMHDTLRYISADPVYRQHHQHDLTFGLDYAFSENFVLPLSHDEVVHGKGSLLGRMPGDHWQRFANLRAYFAFMWTHPGKKLLFMGGELAQPSEWNHDAALDWGLLDDDSHRGIHTLIGELNRLYRTYTALHALDCEAAGFEWIAADDAAQSVVAFLRHDGHGGSVLVVCNFTPVPRAGYRIGVAAAGSYLRLMNTDESVYGGSGYPVAQQLDAESLAAHGRAHSLALTLPPLATLIYRVPGS